MNSIVDGLAGGPSVNFRPLTNSRHQLHRERESRDSREIRLIRSPLGVMPSSTGDAVQMCAMTCIPGKPCGRVPLLIDSVHKARASKLQSRCTISFALHAFMIYEPANR
jgi:hypothetical protein